MTSTAASPAPSPSSEEADAAALQSPFVRALVRQLRAHDTNGFWERKSDSELLGGYIVTREQRRAMPAIADPDPKTLWRVEQYYAALGLAIEQATGIIAIPMLKLTHEGFGRALMVAGRLVVLSRNLRDVHRFGFESLGKLAADGEKLVAQAVAAIEEFPEVARY